jgi:hypothetical protein
MIPHVREARIPENGKTIAPSGIMSMSIRYSP